MEPPAEAPAARKVPEPGSCLSRLVDRLSACPGDIENTDDLGHLVHVERDKAVGSERRLPVLGLGWVQRHGIPRGVDQLDERRHEGGRSGTVAAKATINEVRETVGPGRSRAATMSAIFHDGRCLMARKILSTSRGAAGLCHRPMPCNEDPCRYDGDNADEGQRHHRNGIGLKAKLGIQSHHHLG